MTNFGGLILGCIKTDFCKQIFLLQFVFSIYKLCMFLRRSSLGNSATDRQNVWEIVLKVSFFFVIGYKFVKFDVFESISIYFFSQ